MNEKLQKGEYLDVLLRSPKTIFSNKDAALLWNEDNRLIINNRLKKYVKAGKLIRVRRGLYAKDKKYNVLELATRINTPSYISFETVLANQGVNFQFYKNIFVASYINRKIKIDGQEFIYVRIKDYVLSNNKGIDFKDEYSIASKERAFLDRVYLSKDYHFDNLAGLNWEKVFEILPIYKNKRMEQKIEEYFKSYKK